MRFPDILRFALTALAQQKLRTALTTLGAVIGTFVLVLSLSVGVGVREAAMRQFRRNDRLRRVEVMPHWQAAAQVPPEKLAVKGAMSAAKRARLRADITRHWSQGQVHGPRVALTAERLRRLAALPHVESVRPSVRQPAAAVFRGKAENVLCAAAPPADPYFRERVVAGGYFDAGEADAVLVSEYLLYRFGIADDAQVGRALNQPLRLEVRRGEGSSPVLLLYLLNVNPTEVSPEQTRVLQKVVAQLPAAFRRMRLQPGERAVLEKLLRESSGPSKKDRPTVLARTFTIAGVFRSPTEAELRNRVPWGGNPYEDVLLPVRAVEDWLGKLVGGRPYEFDQATVTVDDEDHVQEVADRIEADGFNAYSLADVARRVRVNLLLISFALAFVALVALLVAVLGIINTMLMAVLERTREIGIMKAVGARDGHVQLIFLLEGAVIGLIGGGLGLLFSWLASFPGDAYARGLMERQTQAPVDETLFAFPLWLTLGVPLFAGLVTTLAAVLPARRAAKVNPVTALRYE